MLAFSRQIWLIQRVLAQVFCAGSSALFMALAATPVCANDTESGIVVFNVVEEKSIPLPLVKTSADTSRGKAVIADRKLGNCLACHQISAMNEWPFHGNVAPALDGVADRYAAGEIRMLLVNPKLLFPGTIMPAFYRVDGLHRVADKFKGKPILTAQQIEDVVAFVMTLKAE